MRMGSAIVLGAVALAATLAGIWPFAVFVAGWAAVASWEWGRLVRATKFDAELAVHTGAIVLASALLAGGAAWATILVLPVAALALVVMRAGHGDWLSALGVLYTGLPALALIWFRSDPVYGWMAVIFLFAVVWLTDSAAFLFGRAIGGARLIPSVSPNKTWAGFLGAAATATATGAVFALVMGATSVVVLGGVALVLSLAAQMGDIAESKLKRSHGIKDSSGLIPGHGGLLDRTDSLVAAVVAAGALSLLRQSEAPGAALLVW